MSPEPGKGRGRPKASSIETQPFSHPRSYRWHLLIGGTIALAAMVALFSVFLWQLGLHSGPDSPVEDRRFAQKGLPICLAGLAGLLFLVWYLWGFTITFHRDGVTRRRRWPFRSSTLPWSEMVRIDFFSQQRRLNLGGRPSDSGIMEGEKIGGLRFWGRDGRVITCDSDYFKLDSSYGVVAVIFGEIVGPQIRKAAEEGQFCRIRLLRGSAAQENGFVGDFHKLYKTKDLGARGTALQVTHADGSTEWVSSGSLDHAIFEVLWGPGDGVDS